MRHSKLLPFTAIGLAVLAAAGLPRRAQAQHTPDPYNIVGEYNVGYENYMYPTYPNGAGYTPNQGILQGRVGVSRANQFQSYLDGILGIGGGPEEVRFGTSRGGGTFAQPYYRAHRQYDEAFDRIYTPNAAVDQKFRAEQEERTKLYLEYLKERDPKKRAQLFRAYNQHSLRLARDADVGPARAGARTRTPASTSTPSSRPGAPSAAPTASPASSLFPASPASRANMFRRSPGAASGLSRSRSTPESPPRSESAEDILERAIRPVAPPDLPAPAGSSAVPR
jgi:hypothetical protein